MCSGAILYLRFHPATAMMPHFCVTTGNLYVAYFSPFSLKLPPDRCQVLPFTYLPPSVCYLLGGTFYPRPPSSSHPPLIFLSAVPSLCCWYDSGVFKLRQRYQARQSCRDPLGKKPISHRANFINMEQGAHLQLCLTCFERDIPNHKQGGRSQKSFFYPSDDTEGASAQFANSFSWFQHISELQNVRNVDYKFPLLWLLQLRLNGAMGQWANGNRVEWRDDEFFF